MPTDPDKLEALARAATPGEWFIYKATPWQIHDKDKLVATARHKNNAAYIAAANPAAILALIERVRVAETALADVRDTCDGHEDADDGIPNLAMRCMTIAEGKHKP